MVNNAFTERRTLKSATGAGLTGGTIHIAGRAATTTDVLVRLERLDRTAQVTRLTPSTPSFVVEAAPGQTEVARTYIMLGIEHIPTGIDHLLFVLALLIITRGGWKLVKTVTAFTISHSLTLTAATPGWVHVPPAPVEAIIALSIVFVAAEIVRMRRGVQSITTSSPWLVAFSFGLIHGLGFAGGAHSDCIVVFQPRCRDRSFPVHRLCAVVDCICPPRPSAHPALGRICPSICHWRRRDVLGDPADCSILNGIHDVGVWLTYRKQYIGIRQAGDLNRVGCLPQQLKSLIDALVKSKGWIVNVRRF